MPAEMATQSEQTAAAVVLVQVVILAVAVVHIRVVLVAADQLHQSQV